MKGAIHEIFWPFKETLHLAMWLSSIYPPIFPCVCASECSSVPLFVYLSLKYAQSLEEDYTK